MMDINVNAKNEPANTVIFDRDGVLTYFDIARAQEFFRPLVPYSVFELAKRWQKWGLEVGFPATIEQEQAFFSGFWQQLRQENQLNDVQYSTLAECRYTDFMQSYPEAADVLQTLKRRNVRVGVLSNFSLASLDASLQAVGIREWIDVACAATVIGYAKPQPEAYQHVARLLQTPPEACLFFDDELPCVEGAQQVGMKSYFVDRQVDGVTPPRNTIPSNTIRNLREVLSLLSDEPFGN